MGGYDNLPLITGDTDGIEYYCYTDHIPQNTNRWNCVLLTPIFKDNKLNVQYLKANPHLLFPWNSIVIWIDANIETIEISKEQIYGLLQDHSIASLPHPHRHFLYGESAVVADRDLDNKNKLAKWESEIKSMGFPDSDDLAELRFLIRDLNNSSVRIFNKTWWSFMLEGSRRDQLSFTPALWYHNLKWKAISLNLEAKYHSNPHKRAISNEFPSFMVSDFSPYCWTELIDSKDSSGKIRKHYLHHEYWTEELLENLRSIYEIVEEHKGTVEENYFYVEKKITSKYSIPDIRYAWKREYLKKSILPSRWGLEIGFKQGHSAALMLAYNPELSIIAIAPSQDQITSACAQKLSSAYPNRLEVYYDNPAKALAELSGKLPFEKIEFIHYNSPALFDLEEFKSFMEWYLCKSTIGCRIIISDMNPDMNFIMDELCLSSILTQIDPGVPNICENRQYVKYSQMSVDAFKDVFSENHFNKDNHELLIIRDKNTSLQHLNEALMKENAFLKREVKNNDNVYFYLIGKLKSKLKRILENLTHKH